MISYSFILTNSINYEGTWVLGVVSSLNEAKMYFEEKLKDKRDVFNCIEYNVKVFNGTQKICTFRFNTKTRLLEKQELMFGEIGDENLLF